jgi:hypothetical protein
MSFSRAAEVTGSNTASRYRVNRSHLQQRDPLIYCKMAHAPGEIARHATFLCEFIGLHKLWMVMHHGLSLCLELFLSRTSWVSAESD